MKRTRGRGAFARSTLLLENKKKRRGSLRAVLPYPAVFS